MRSWPFNTMYMAVMHNKFRFDLFSFAACVSRPLTSNATPIFMQFGFENLCEVFPKNPLLQ